MIAPNQGRARHFRAAECVVSRACAKVATGTPVALGQTVLPLVAVSGAECVEALVLDGFTVRSRSDAAVVLERDMRVVVVPDTAMLAPEELEAVLRDAAIPYDAFLDLLSETPTDPAVFRPTSGIRRSSA